MVLCPVDYGRNVATTFIDWVLRVVAFSFCYERCFRWVRTSKHSLGDRLSHPICFRQLSLRSGR